MSVEQGYRTILTLDFERVGRPDQDDQILVRLRGGSEAFKAGETPGGHLVCMTASGVGWLIQAMVGSLGGVGRRANRWGVAA